jgi:cupin superfamily acireductone dioxygenase involved in methionine salvage
MHLHLPHDTALRVLGIAGGRLASRASSVSSLPQLNHARDLLALQKRFGTLRTDRVQACRQLLACGQLHVHDDIELRVLIAGRLRVTVQGWGSDDLLSIDCGPGDWLALPAGLPHRVALQSSELDLLRLFSRPGGWRASAPRAQPEPLAA